jgi:hypothetical protein
MTAPVFVDFQPVSARLGRGGPKKTAGSAKTGAPSSGRATGHVSFRVLGEFHLNPRRLLPEARDEGALKFSDLLAWIRS